MWIAFKYTALLIAHLPKGILAQIGAFACVAQWLVLKLVWLRVAAFAARGLVSMGAKIIASMSASDDRGESEVWNESHADR